MFPDYLSAEQIAALELHYELLCRWNKILNLTTVTSREDAIERHYGESLFLAAHLPGAPGLRIVDIGSGAGFPGFPLAVTHPEWLVTMVESHQRKAVFLREVSRMLPNVRVLAARAEQVAEQFDWAISRAVSYADLLKPLKRLASHAALLTGAEAPPETLGEPIGGPIPLPGGQQRFLRLFHVKQD